jgi:RND family efflux transporter MFP subunit
MSGRAARGRAVKAMTTMIEGEKTMRGRMSAAAVVCAACLIGLAGCGGEKKHGDETAKSAAPAAAGVRTAPVATEEVGLSRELAGSVQSAAISQISSRIMAQVLSVAVSEGDPVQKGKVLVTLDDRELQAKVRQAESAVRQAEAARSQAASQLDLATATHGRYKTLLEGRAVSRQEYEHVAAQEAVARAAVAQAEGAVAQAADAVEEAKTWLAFTVIASPVSGRVTAKRIDPGSMAAPGQPLLVIEHEGRYRVELPVDSSLSGTIARGTPLSVAIEAAGYQGIVAVTEVVPAADPASRTYIVRAGLPANPRIGSGQYARVTVALGKRAAVVVPESALVKRGQLDGVYVEATGKLAFRIVQLGKPAGAGKVEILSGLVPGERIVVEGAERAVDGAAAPGAGR